MPDELTANIDRCNYNVPTPVQKNLGEKAKTCRLKCCSAFKSALNVRKVLSNCWCYTFKEGVLTIFDLQFGFDRTCWFLACALRVVRHSIPAVLDGSDVLVTAQTGSADLDTGSAACDTSLRRQ